MIGLIFVPNPIAQAVLILLEECRQIEAVEDYTPGLLASAEGKNDLAAPVLLDDPPDRTGEPAPIVLQDPAAAMAYLAARACAVQPERAAAEFVPRDPGEQFEALRWVAWQTALQLFRPRFERGEAVVDRARELFGILDARVGKGWIAGQCYTIADMACFPWVANWRLGYQGFGDFRNLERWFQDVEKRPAVERGMRKGQERPPDLGEALSRAIRYSFVAGDPTTPWGIPPIRRPR